MIDFKNKNILTIMPSRNRPGRCQAAVRSLLNNSTMSDIRVLIDSDDPSLEEYMNHEEKYFYEVKERQTITQRINSCSMDNVAEYDYFHLTNDDTIYHTKDWDMKFIYTNKLKKNFIVYGNDLFQGQNLCTFPFISKEIVKCLGWLQMPLLNKYFGDMVWKVVGSQANCLYFTPDVIIEHLHFLANKDTEPTEEFMKEYMDIYTKDKSNYVKWLINSDDEIQKVREICKSA